MKKFICVLLSIIFIIPCFAFSVSADTFELQDFFNLMPQTSGDSSVIEVAKQQGDYTYLYRIFVEGSSSKVTMNYITDDDQYQTAESLTYRYDSYSIRTSTGETIGTGHGSLPSTKALTLNRIIGVSPAPPKGSGNYAIRFINIDVLVDGLVIYNSNNCPDVFTYSIDRSNFTLQNGQSMNVNISFTPNYVNFITELRKEFPDVPSLYNFLIYVSDVKPTDTASLLESMNNSRYTKLQYGEYLYEGGVGYAQLHDSPNPSVNGDDTSSLSEVPTSHSGKSAWTTAYGAHVCTTLGVDAGITNYPINIMLENIEGFDDHTPIYVCVLGAYCGGKNDPQAFNEYNLQQALAGHSTPNDTYTEFFETHTEAENETPDYTFHTYYFPFECAANCVGDGYQGNCQYKPQVVNGKSYANKKKISDYTNKGIIPERIHDVDMSDTEWVKPEDYKKWQHDKYNSSKYSNEFNYDVVGLKDVLDQEGDFFKFISSAFNVFPSYVLNIFVGFLIAMLAIVLLKFIL